MSKVYHFVKITPAYFFGVGYFRDNFTEGSVRGWCVHVFIPFFHVRIAWLERFCEPTERHDLNLN